MDSVKENRRVASRHSAVKKARTDRHQLHGGHKSHQYAVKHYWCAVRRAARAMVRELVV